MKSIQILPSCAKTQRLHSLSYRDDQTSVNVDDDDGCTETHSQLITSDAAYTCALQFFINCDCCLVNLCH